MYPQSNQGPPPPPYQQNMQVHAQYDQYYRPAEERMADFQELVGRYESQLKYHVVEE